jgi:prephenate dehydratase
VAEANMVKISLWCKDGVGVLDGVLAVFDSEKINLEDLSVDANGSKAFITLFIDDENRGKVTEIIEDLRRVEREKFEIGFNPTLFFRDFAAAMRKLSLVHTRRVETSYVFYVQVENSPGALRKHIVYPLVEFEGAYISQLRVVKRNKDKDRTAVMMLELKEHWKSSKPLYYRHVRELLSDFLVEGIP